MRCANVAGAIAARYMNKRTKPNFFIPTPFFAFHFWICRTTSPLHHASKTMPEELLALRRLRRTKVCLIWDKLSPESHIHNSVSTYDWEFYFRLKAESSRPAVRGTHPSKTCSS